MKKLFSPFLPVFLLFLSLALGTGDAVASEKKKSRMPQGPNLDTSEPAPQRGLGSELRHHSYIIPYIPEDLVMEWDSPEAGPCREDGRVVPNGRSSRKCNIYHSRETNSVYKVMNLNDHGYQSIPTIFRREEGRDRPWEVWVECSGGQCTPVSARAQQYAAAKAGSGGQPQYARESQPVPGIPNMPPDMGTLLNGIMRAR